MTRIPLLNHLLALLSWWRAVPCLDVLTGLLANPAISLTVLTKMLYRCDSEELDDSRGRASVYVVPGYEHYRS